MLAAVAGLLPLFGIQAFRRYPNVSWLLILNHLPQLLSTRCGAELAILLGKSLGLQTHVVEDIG